MTDIEIKQLKEKNYVRVAQPSNNYWVDFTRAKLNDFYISKFQENFNIILHSNPDFKTHYYVIPFTVVKELFIDDNLVNDKTRTNNSRRWIVLIKDHFFKVTHSSTTIDVSKYYLNPILFTNSPTYPGDLSNVIFDDVASLNFEDNSNFEGNKKMRLISYYERNAKLRSDAIKIHGTECKICSFDF